MEQIKVELPDRTKFQMPICSSGNNKKYLVHVIAVLHLVKQNGTAAEVKEAFTAVVAVGKEMNPFFCKRSKNEETPRAQQIPQGQERHCCGTAYELFHCFVAGKVRMHWGRIVNEVHTNNPWIGVNGKSNKGIRVKS